MDHHIRYLLDRGGDGDDHEALRLVDEELTRAPNNAQLLVLRSEALRNLEMYGDAVEAARAASRAHESAAYTHAALGEALLDLAEEEDDEALLGQAGEAFQAALLRDPELWSAHFWLAECTIRLGAADDGLVRMAGVARATSWDQAALTRVARLVADGVRPIAQAEREAQRTHPDENLVLGIALRRAGDLAAAGQEFETERRLDPLSREPAYQLARVEALAGNLPEALAQLAWPCDAEGFFEAWVLRGQVLQALGRATEAKASLERALPPARRWSDPAEVEALELRLLEPDGDGAWRQDGDSLQEEILRAMVREQRLASAHDSPQAHCLQMARAATEVYERAGRAEETAWRIVRTARAHSAPQLASEAWSAAVNQAGDAWEVLTVSETAALAGIIVLASWYATSGEFEGRDCAVLGAAAVSLAEHAVRDAEANGRTVTAYDELLNRWRAELREAAEAGPTTMDGAGRIVGEAIGQPGGAGLLHELAVLRPRRRF